MTEMAGWLPYQAALAALSAGAGHLEAAAAAYAAALDLDPAPAERLYLEAQARRLVGENLRCP